MSGNPYLDLLNEEEQRLRQADASRSTPGNTPPMGAPAAPPPAANDNPYSALIEQQDSLARAQQVASLRAAVGVNPDQAGEAARLARRYPAPADVVLRNLSDVRLQAAVDDADARLKTSPKLAEYMRTSPFAAKQAHDDLPTLSSIEALLGGMKGSVVAGAYRADRGAAGTFQAGLEFAAPLLDVLERFPDAGGNPLRRLAEGFAMIGAADEADAKKARPKTEGALAGGFFSGIESLTQNVLALPAAMVNPAAGLTAMVAMTGGDAYQQAREKGLPMSQALPFATSQAAIEYATEKLPLFKLIGDVKAGTPLFKTIATQAALEIPGEQVATVLQDMNEWAILNPEKPFSDYLAERPGAVAQTLVATIVGTGGNVAVAKGLERVGDITQRMAANKAQAERAAEVSKAMMAFAEASKLRERNPEEFRSMMESMGEGAEVFVDAEVLNQLPIDQQQAMHIEEQMPAALASGGSVSLKVSDILTFAPGTPMADMLINNARLTPDGVSLAETQQAGEKAQEWIKAEADRVIAEASDQQTAQASSDTVRQQVLDELNAAGRFRPAVNENYASLVAAFYTTMGGRAGLSAEQFAAKYPLRVVSTLAQEQALNQPAPDTPEFKAWFGDSKVVDADGKPLVVYHGTGRDFDEFKPRPKVADDNSYARDGYVGMFFSVDPETADYFAGDAAQRIMPVYLSLQNPLTLDMGGQQKQPATVIAAAEKAKADGHDGLILLNLRDAGTVRNDHVLIAFRPEQIKSAIGNSGAFDPNDPSILRQSARQEFDQTETPAFKRWANDAPLITQAEALTHAFKTGAKIVVEAFHGTKRPDRVGTKFLKKRATSGPMAFHTSDPGLASNYASGKQDTSLANEDQDYASWFKVKLPGDRSTTDLVRAWYRLTPEQKDRIAALAPRVTYSEEQNEDGSNKIVLGDAGHDSGTGSYDYNLSATKTSWDRRGNPLKALVEDWLNSGNLFNDEEQFMTVLKLAGFPMESVEYDSPTSEYPFVYKNYIAMQRPLVTSEIPQEVADALNAAAKKDRSRAKQSGADMWDKNTRTLKDWVAAFNGPDNKYVWTSIPDKVTAVFQSLGYDGIVDWSGKNGGPGAIVAPVYVPFSETQVKSAIGNKGSFDSSKNDILKQGARGTFSPSRLEIALGSNADLSTFLHETGHFFLEVMADIASQPDAPADVQKDMAAIMGWFGVADVAAWHGMTLEQQRPFHERFAESFEQYLLEGKAPSVELAPMFRRFRSWLTSIYKSVQNFLGGNGSADSPIQLSDEVRQVFDRMLASEEQIKQTEEVAGLLPDEEATNRAIEKLTARSLRDLKWTVGARGRAIKALQAQAKEARAAVEAEITEEIDALPVVKAKQALDALQVNPDFTAAQGDWKARRQAALEQARADIKDRLVAAEGPELVGLKKGQFLAKSKKTIENQAQAAAIEWEKDNPAPVRSQNATDADLEVVADSFGFDSADAMLQAVDAFGNKADVIQAMTDQRMLQEHGDLIDQQAIEQAANEAVHNQARARALATELRTQAEAMNERKDTGKTTADGRRLTVNAIMEAAKQFAANIVERTLMRDMRSRAAQHTAAERRAAAKWRTATAAGKTAEAIKAKQDQVLNHAAARALLEAADGARKDLDYLKKFDKAAVRARLTQDYVDQIDKLLEVVDLRQTSNKALDKRAALREWVQNQEDLGLPVSIPENLLEDANLKSWKEMTAAEFDDLVDAVKNIEHLGRLKNKLLRLKDKRTFDQIVAEWVKTITENGGKPLPVELEGRGRVKAMVQGFATSHRKIASLMRQWTGGKDGGPLWDAFVRPMNEAGSQEALMIEQATLALADIYKPVLAMPGGLDGDKQFIPEINASLSRGGRLAVALNWGNEQNRQRIKGGDNWTDAQVGAILSRLTPTEAQFVNDVWAYLDSYWPEIKAKQERVSGVVEKKVEAQPFALNLADGTVVQMRGGYYPIKYDADRSGKADSQEAAEVAKDMMRGAFTRATTRRGHTKARVAEVNRPVRKSLDVITQHVTQVVHDLAWHEWIIDANRLIGNKSIEAALREHYGPDVIRTIKSDIEGIATADVVAQTALDQGLRKLRANISRSTMGFSFTTALLQPFGLTQSMARIGVKHVLLGAKAWAGDALHFESSLRKIGEKSDFMRLRAKTMNRELTEINQRVEGRSPTLITIDRGLFWLTTKMQLVADVPTWLGAYEKATAEGLDDATAVARADQAVLDSQGGGQIKDLAEVQRKHPMLTQFYSYFSVTLNLMAEKTGTTDFKHPRAVAGWLGDMALLAVIPAIVPSLLAYMLKGGDDDDPEEWAKRIAKWQLSYLLGLGVLVREFSGAVEGFPYTGPPVARAVSDVGKAAQQTAQGEVDEPAVMAYIRLLGSLFGIPVVQAVRSYKGWVAWEEGDAPPTSILFGPPPKD